MKQILDGIGQLISVLTILNHPVAGSIMVKANNVLCMVYGVFVVNGPTKSTQTMTQGSDSATLRGNSLYFLHPRSFFVNLQTVQLEQSSTSCVRPGHFMVFLMFFSLQLCPG
jgi:hypothetical protein